jgi:iron complex outermembrane receptor protein
MTGLAMISGCKNSRVHLAVRAAIPTIALGFGALAMAPLHAYAAQAQREFNIPSQPLSAALHAYAEQSGMVVTARPDLVEGKLAPEISGQMSDEAALHKLLLGTGLTARRTPKGAITIVPATASRIEPVRTSTAPIHLAQAEETPPLEEITVTGKIIFTQNDAFGATKMGLPIEQTPQTVAIVTSDLIEVASMKSFMDFYKVDASTGTSHIEDGYPRSYYRGFREQGNLGGNNAVRVDGFRMAGNIDLDLAIFDRFEVVKGPTSTLYGQNSVGGLLNAVSKLPQQRFSGRFSIEGGDFSEYRADVDLTGALFASDAWSFRLIGAHEDGDSYIDFAGRNRTLVSPSIQFEPSESTRFILRATYQRDDSLYGWTPILQLAGDGTGSVFERVLSEGLQIADVPRSRFFAMPWNGDEREVQFIQFQGEHDFANDWKLRAHAQHSKLDQATHNFYVQGPFDENGFAYFTSAYGVEVDSTLYAGEVNIFGDIELFGRRHTLFLGADFSRLENELRLSFGGLSFGYEGSLFNAFDPDYTAVPPHAAVDDQYAYVYDDDDEIQMFGGTVQLILRPSERLSLLLGGRQTEDHVIDRGRGGALPGSEVDLLPFTRQKTDFSRFVMQGGATFALTDRVNAYASYGETFKAQFGSVFVEGVDGGRPIEPEEGTSFEAGVKANLTPDLFMSAAYFDMERSGISEGDPEHPGFRLNIGTQRSRGVELGLQGRILPQLSIHASAAYLDAEFTEGAAKGGQPPNAPKVGLSVFGTYEILGGDLKGLGFGLGVVHKRGLEGFDFGWTEDAGRPVTFDFGDFTEVDARAFYETGRWTFSVSGTNLFDETYYSQDRTSLTLATLVNPGRAWRARIGYKF